MFFHIEPEVAGGLGPRSRFDHTDGKRIVTHLNYEFDGWLGDALLESTPCFIVTDAARRMIESAGLTGVSFTDVEITRSALFMDLHGNRSLPHFWWMVINGKGDDFRMAADLRLIVSSRALAVLKSTGIGHAEVHPVTPA